MRKELEFPYGENICQNIEVKMQISKCALVKILGSNVREFGQSAKCNGKSLKDLIGGCMAPSTFEG